MLTRIRNAQIAGHDTVSIPASNMKKSIAKILLNEGYVKNVEFLNEGVQGDIRITLKYVEKRPVIVGLKRISRPGLRVYAVSSTARPRTRGTDPSFTIIHSLDRLSRPTPPVKSTLIKPITENIFHFRLEAKSYTPYASGNSIATTKIQKSASATEAKSGMTCANSALPFISNKLGATMLKPMFSQKFSALSCIFKRYFNKHNALVFVNCLCI